jgi:hypothetical protein
MRTVCGAPFDGQRMIANNVIDRQTNRCRHLFFLLWSRSRQPSTEDNLRDLIQMSGRGRCPDCAGGFLEGDGRCSQCDGRTNTQFDSEQPKCPYRKGTGLCQSCGGSGLRQLGSDSSIFKNSSSHAGIGRRHPECCSGVAHLIRNIFPRPCEPRTPKEVPLAKAGKSGQFGLNGVWPSHSRNSAAPTHPYRLPKGH